MKKPALAALLCAFKSAVFLLVCGAQARLYRDAEMARKIALLKTVARRAQTLKIALPVSQIQAVDADKSTLNQTPKARKSALKDEGVSDHGDADGVAALHERRLGVVAAISIDLVSSDAGDKSDIAMDRARSA